MNRIQCPQCAKRFRKKTGLEWHLKRAHGKTARDNQGKRASMAQEIPERRRISFAELSNATPGVKWASPFGGEIVRALITFDVLDEKDVPKEVREQPELPEEPHRIYLVA